MATIVTRSGKGSPLTNNEVDANFTNLNNDKLETSGGSVTGNVSFSDNAKATFGAGSDLQIYHDGSNSYVQDLGTGKLTLKSNGTATLIQDSAGGAQAEFHAINKTVTLFYNNAAKLATTATGIDVTGTVTADGLTVDTSSGITINGTGTGAVHEMTRGTGATDGSRPVLKLNANSSGDAVDGFGPSLQFTLSDTGVTGNELGAIGFIRDGGDGAGMFAVAQDSQSLSTTRQFTVAANGDISFYEDTGTTPKFFWDASAESLMLNATTRIGSETLTVNGTVTTGGGTAAAPALAFRADADTGMYRPAAQSVGFSTAGSERARITSDGSFLVGTTSNRPAEFLHPDGFSVRGDVVGQIQNTVTNAHCGIFNRDGTDGEIFLFRKEGIAVGSIVTYAGDLIIGDDDIAIRFDTGTGLVPWDIGATATGGSARDAAIDIGVAGARFKDLHLSGTANAAGLSVDGGTIKLDGNHPNGTNNVGLGNATLTNASGANGYSVAVGTSALNGMTTGGSNVGVGYNAGLSITSGANNIAIGSGALDAATTANFNVAVGSNALGDNTTADRNTAVGYKTLAANTTGPSNTAVGYQALDVNTTGGGNVAVGNDALGANILGSRNVAVGQNTLAANNPAASTDMYNVALGYNAGASVTTGTFNTLLGGLSGDALTTSNYNTAVGFQSLTTATTGSNNATLGALSAFSTTTGASNVAVGYAALYNTTEGNRNVAIGQQALNSSTTTDNNTAVGHQAAYSTTTGGSNTALGYQAFYSNTTGVINTALGYQSLFSNTTGNFNIAVGQQALRSNTTASNNTAVGYQAGYSNTTGTPLVAMGYLAAYSNTTGSDIVAIGSQALRYNTTGASNTALGNQALRANTTASNNTAVGYQAGYANTTGFTSVYVGYRAGSANTTGARNVAVGGDAFFSNVDGDNNIAIGFQSLYANTSGANNTAVGYQSLDANTTGTNNTALGFAALTDATTASNNTGLGYEALRLTTTGSSNTAVGIQAIRSNTVGANNVAVGFQSLYTNDSGSANNAMGYRALFANTTGNNNTAVGYQALLSNTTGVQNVAVGHQAGHNNTTANSNTFVGRAAGLSTTTGGSNTYIGEGAGYSAVSATDNTFVGQDSGVLVTGSKNTILGCYNGNQGGLDIRTANNHIVLSDGDGNVRAFWDNAGNMYMHTSGSGIYLGGASSANLLDDYEEGTWTPSLTGSTGNPTLVYGTQLGAYTKIGRLVHLSFFIYVSSVTSQGTGYLAISGMPFTTSSSTNQSEVRAVLLQAQPFLSSHGSDLIAYFRTQATSTALLGGYINQTSQNATVPSTGAANVGTGYLIGHVTYQV